MAGKVNHNLSAQLWWLWMNTRDTIFEKLLNFSFILKIINPKFVEKFIFPEGKIFNRQKIKSQQNSLFQPQFHKNPVYLSKLKDPFMSVPISKFAKFLNKKFLKKRMVSFLSNDFKHLEILEILIPPRKKIANINVFSETHVEKKVFG